MVPNDRPQLEPGEVARDCIDRLLEPVLAAAETGAGLVAVRADDLNELLDAYFTHRCMCPSSTGGRRAS